MDPVLLKVVHRVSGCTSGTKIGFGQCHLQSKWILVSLTWSHECSVVLLLIAASGLCVTPLRLQPPHSNSYSTSYKRSCSISHGQTNVHTQRQKKRLGPQPPPPPPCDAPWAGPTTQNQSSRYGSVGPTTVGSAGLHLSRPCRTS